ncbi:MAG TPA: helix-turn-helix transcriptional regulator [Fibrobacteria bacterium]|nr:helix-turn-helix transcriptional regulator [Fibrobacteria bacterium]
MAFRTIEQIETLIGEKLRSYRLELNKSQEEVAAMAGVSAGVLRRLESGEGTNLRAFIKVVKALRLEEWFETLAPIPAVNPYLMVEDRPRRRARKKKAGNAS